jgi:hypothetical protein
MEGAGMKCADVEILLCDYLDGTLSAGEREQLDRHLATCAACAELARDAGAAVAFIDRVPAVEPPVELMTGLLFNTLWRQPSRPIAGFRGWLAGLLRPVLQPRFVMGMALTILSFSMLGRYVLPGRPIQQGDLDPGKIWMALDNRVHRLWDGAVKKYESIRFVYQIQSRLREWQEQQATEDRPPEPPADSSPDSRRLPVTPPQANGKAKTK